MDISKAQQALKDSGIPGWALYSFLGSNPLAVELLGLTNIHLSRRFLYLIPVEGEPTLVVHAIEQSTFPDLPGKRRVFSSWESFVHTLEEVVLPLGKVAMEYQPGGSIPYLSRVDAGTLELLRGMGLEVVSSANLLLSFQVWDQAALAAHLKAARGVEAAKDAALAFLRSRLKNPPSELEVQTVMASALGQHGLFSDHPPMVGFGSHAANPHHRPDGTRLQRGQVVLLDVWAKRPDGPFADITWMAGWEVPAEVHQAFDVVKRARDHAVKYVAQAYREGRHPKGSEVDRASRKVIEDAGYGKYLLHRTGHNLGWSSPHGNGTHLDGLEAPDKRPLIPGLAFTVEPGIYPGPFGVRSEINVYLRPSGPEITTSIQEQLDELEFA